MQQIPVRVHPANEPLPETQQLAWKIAAFATGEFPIQREVAQMVACRLMDNASVAIASLHRGAVTTARLQALCHPRDHGGTLYGLDRSVRVHAEWAAWANATAVRELDYHDTFLAADYAHPGDNIAPLIAVAQQCGCSGADLLRGIVVAYEVQVALVKGISLHEFKKDHVGHLAPASVAGIGAMLKLPVGTVYQAINQAVHLAYSTRQSRKGLITSWKAFVPGFSGKLAIEAVDRAMRGEGAPNPIYEGADGVIAWMLGGPGRSYSVSLPEPLEAPRGILETYTKAHSAEYQAQALIDLAIEMGTKIDLSRVDSVLLHTSHHTHHVIGSGANDPQKKDPKASRETLDHSISYILAVALEDGRWHHVDSYLPERANRPSTVALWQRIDTLEDPRWTALYNSPDPARRAFGGTLEIRMQDGTVHRAEKAVADAHPNGARPWGVDDYRNKLEVLAGESCQRAELDRIAALALDLENLGPEALVGLLPVVKPALAPSSKPDGQGIFDYPKPA